MQTLVVTEKPNVAERIANSLGKAVRKSHGGVSYYEVGDYMVAPAVGHIFGLREKDAEGWKYPVFNIEWVPSHLVSKTSDYTKKYLDNIRRLSKDCGRFVNACDYDVEGEVIGYNVIKYGCGQDPTGDTVSRVKFSTLTSDAIVKAFEKMGPIDHGLADAGISRHILDWYWGINLSRALSSAARRGRRFTTLSIGRVQGPTLRILAERERSIMAFRSEKYWEVEMLCHKELDFSAMYEAGKLVFSLTEKPDAQAVSKGYAALGLLAPGESLAEVVKDSSDDSVDRWVARSGQGRSWSMTLEREDKEEILKLKPDLEGAVEIRLWVEADVNDPAQLNIYQGELHSAEAAERVKENCGPTAVVSDVGLKRYRQPAPYPFDLTTLQTEAYRHFGIDPRETLQVAQDLYTNAYISYPRTSSQQIPDDIDCRKIIDSLSRQEEYGGLCGQLLAGKKLTPAKGGKTDPAHPAIHPTGEAPSRLDVHHRKVYDLVVRRFLAAFGEDAVRQTVTVRLDNNREPFTAKGNTTVERGWHVYYGPYAKFEENELPPLVKGDSVLVKDVVVHAKETKPPKRYTPASIIREMEKHNIGTKATRSQIVDILFKRGYVNGKSLEVSRLGLSVVDAMAKYCPDVISVELTRRFEEEMDSIWVGKMASGKVIGDGKDALTKILAVFKENESKIGDALIESINSGGRQASNVGKCQKCGDGDLIIRSSKLWQFIGCSNYPKCNNSWSLPRDPIEKGKECKECGYSTITVKPKGNRKYSICVNPQCPTRNAGKPMDDVGACPKCQCKLLVRMSRYGTQFIGCSGWPKCNNLWPLPKDSFEKTGKCGSCGYPLITVSPENKPKYEVCVNPDCATRKKG